MSYPPAGFPDYSRFQPNGGRFLGNLTGVINTDPITPHISSTGFTHLVLTTNSNGVSSDFAVNLEWGGNSDPSSFGLSSGYGPSNDNFNVVCFPVIGEWFRVSHSFYRGPGNESPSTYIFGTNFGLSGSELLGFGQQSIVQNVTVPHGTSPTFGMLGIAPGKAIFGVNSVTAVNWFAQLQQYDVLTGAWLTTYQISGDGTTNQVTIPVGLLPLPCRIQLFDSSATNQVYGITLIPVP